MSVLGWLEMQEEDQPPQEIWLDSEKLELHFQAVRERYQSESNGNTEKVEEPEGGMMENELMKGWRK
jgi:hypothetical protein